VKTSKISPLVEHDTEFRNGLPARTSDGVQLRSIQTYHFDKDHRQPTVVNPGSPGRSPSSTYVRYPKPRHLVQRRLDLAHDELSMAGCRPLRRPADRRVFGLQARGSRSARGEACGGATTSMPASGSLWVDQASMLDIEVAAAAARPAEGQAAPADWPPSPTTDNNHIPVRATAKPGCSYNIFRPMKEGPDNLSGPSFLRDAPLLSSPRVKVGASSQVSRHL